jgi:hypothetical protein
MEKTINFNNKIQKNRIMSFYQILKTFHKLLKIINKILELIKNKYKIKFFNKTKF